MSWLTPSRINRIAFIDLEGRLSTIAPDGTDYHPISLSNHVYQFPAWSPCGKLIAAIGSDRSGAGVYLFRDKDVQVGKGRYTQLFYSYEQLPFYLSWSPNSEMVSFLATYTHGLGLHIGSIKKATSQLLTTGEPCFWHWTRDSTQLFIHIGSPDHHEHRLTFIDHEIDDLDTNIATAGAFQTPGISADGQYWAFAECNHIGQANLVIEQSNSYDRQTIDHQGIAMLTWSPTAPELAFICPEFEANHYYGPLQLWHAPSGEIHRLTDQTVIAFFWSPNGRYLAYFTIAHMPPSLQGLVLNLSIMDVQTHQRKKLFSFQPPPLFVNQFLPFFSQYALSHQLWSPDSDALVLPIIANRIPRIVVVPIDGSDIVPIAEGFAAFWSRS